MPHDSDGNGVFEPGEHVDLAPAWKNDDSVPLDLAGAISGFDGPPGADYVVSSATAEYGTIAPGDTVSCLDSDSCYALGVNAPLVRPALHWDAMFDEVLDEVVAFKSWRLHIGDSFADVPRSHLFYRWIETLLHNGVTGGCGSGDTYCPGAAVSRSQMPASMLRTLAGAGYTPPDCATGETRLFADVPSSNPFCPWIEELANRGIVTGCGGGNYCPSSAVTRAQMAAFLLKTLEGPDYVPTECTDRFVDVPCPSIFADWIEDLAERGITGGCSETRYCPSDKVTRGQMAAFISKTLGFTLYGP